VSKSPQFAPPSIFWPDRCIVDSGPNGDFVAARGTWLKDPETAFSCQQTTGVQNFASENGGRNCAVVQQVREKAGICCTKKLASRRSTNCSEEFRTSFPSRLSPRASSDTEASMVFVHVPAFIPSQLQPTPHRVPVSQAATGSSYRHLDHVAQDAGLGSSERWSIRVCRSAKLSPHFSHGFLASGAFSVRLDRRSARRSSSTQVGFQENDATRSFGLKPSRCNPYATHRVTQKQMNAVTPGRQMTGRRCVAFARFTGLSAP